ncbi:MAG: transcription antitermination factor NusB [Lachnospiraceae bacterium]|nr:transcription antitermination factor NusB [Lachnospiraceae bacterium]
MSRREVREHIFKLLYMSEFNTKEEMPQQVALYLESLEPVSEENQKEIEDKYEKIKEHAEEIDTAINESSVGWKSSRMSKVDLNILRVAVYELKYDDSVPTGVAINEAVEIAKSFGGEESASFLNGILAKMV